MSADTGEDRRDGLSLSYQQRISVEVREEKTFIMRQSDWVRLRRRVERLQKQRREFAAAAWAFVGVAVFAVFGMISWAPTYRVLTPEQQFEFAWIWPALIGTFLGALVLSAAMFWAAHVTKDAASETID